MGRSDPLTDGQREAAVALLEQGYGYYAAASVLGVSRHAVRHLRDRWRVRGREALVARSVGRPGYSFDFKLDLVLRHLAGESAPALAAEAGLSSPHLLWTWARRYRREGPEALRPKPPGPAPRPKDGSGGEESELERLQRENERLRAEVALLGKLKALREQARE